jgi:ferric-dicitrate binding protein FerR (iron transport regulator)
MAMPSDELRREMEPLLMAVGEGTLGPDGRRALSRLLRQEPDARRLYVEYCQMHAMLRSAHGELSAVAPERERRGRRPVRWLAVAALLVVAIAVATAVYQRPRTPDHSASVVAVQGEVRVVRDGAPSVAIAGIALRPGDQIQTEPAASAEVRLADGTSIRLGSTSSIRLLLRQDGRCVELRGGSVTCDVRPQPEGKPLVFASPHADVTVLGTVFELNVAPVATAVHVSQGRVRLSASGHVADVGAGGLASADAVGVYTWSPVSRLDFAGMKGLPAQLETVYCDSTSLHSDARNIVPAPENVALTKEGLRFVDAPGRALGHGLAVMRWAEEVGGDVAVEVDVSAGPRWSLGFAVDGDSFEGYRVIFAAPSYPYGITVDTIHPSALTLLAQDPRPIPHESDHILRVEKLGQRMRVWVDGELRIDTRVTHPVPAGRRSSVAISSFGNPPLIRAMRVWKAAPAAQGG